MPILKKSHIFRGGRTANFITPVDCPITCIDSKDGVVELAFSLPSKGGGITEIRVRLGVEDFSEMLDMLAKRSPEKMAVMLSEASAKATKGLSRKLGLEKQSP